MKNARGGVFVDVDKVDEDDEVVNRALGALGREGFTMHSVRPASRTVSRGAGKRARRSLNYYSRA